MTILDEIFTHKRQEVARARQAAPEVEVVRAAAAATPARDFIAALRAAGQLSSGTGLIAEIKAASPSKGVLMPDFNPLTLSDTYVENGAAAISVLTDEHYFKGHLNYLRQIRARHPLIPLLRKDFVFDPYQVYEARAAGADAVLLIAAMLEIDQLASLHTLAAQLGMAALIEVHTEEELCAVLQVNPQLIGINNRDLHSFRVSLGVSLALRPLIPSEVTVVAESGINSQADVLRLIEAGIHGILVGEALVTAADIPSKVRELAFSSLLPASDHRRRKFCEG